MYDRARRPRMVWRKDRPASPGEKEFHLTGLRMLPDARALDAPLERAERREREIPGEPHPKWL